jgi:predicted dehydrogenase
VLPAGRVAGGRAPRGVFFGGSPGIDAPAGPGVCWRRFVFSWHHSEEWRMSKRNFPLSRRAFLAATSTSVVAAGCAGKAGKDAGPSGDAAPAKKPASDQVNIAAIGAGGKGFDDLWNCHKLGHNIIALCDPDEANCEQARYKFPNAKYYRDYRKMLEEMPEIDACTISTPDHTHAPAAYQAMKLGKHVYVQKPLTHTIAEARLLAKTAAETGVITQMGNQGHSGDGVRDLCEMLWSGVIGEVKEAHIWTNRPIWPQGLAAPLPAEDAPATMDWDLWLGTAPQRAYNKGYAPFNWRGWWDYGCGAIGDMACHIMDPAFWALKLIDAQHYSVEVVAQEGMTAQCPPNKSVIKFSFPARGAMAPCEVYWYDGGLMPKRPDAVGPDEKLGDGDNGSLFIGSKGILTSGTYGGDSRLLPGALMKDYTRPAQTIPRVEKENHYKNWLDAIVHGGTPNSNFAYAGALTEVANFGNVALLAGERVDFDVAAMRITNVAAANQYLSKEYRAGWELPV